MSIRYPILIILCFVMVQAVFAQNVMTFDSGGVKFNHPSDASIDDRSQQGSFNVINIQSGNHDYISICVHRNSITVEESLKTFKDQNEKVFTDLKAQNMKFKDIKESVLSTPAKGFLQTFTLNGKDFENKVLSTVYQGKVIVITRQSLVSRKAEAEKFFNQILSSLVIQ
ncbi:MAG: hypothetical protein AB9903_24130 [Vulcanimicrobiota bacterium]